MLSCSYLIFFLRGRPSAAEPHSRLQIVGASQLQASAAGFINAAPPSTVSTQGHWRQLSASARCDAPVAKRDFGIQRELSNFTSVLNNINLPSQFTYKTSVLHLDLWQGCISVNRYMFWLSVKKLGLVLPPACHTAEVTGSAPRSAMHRRLNKYQCQAWHLANVCMCWIYMYSLPFRLEGPTCRVSEHRRTQKKIPKKHPHFHENGLILVVCCFYTWPSQRRSGGQGQ